MDRSVAKITHEYARLSLAFYGLHVTDDAAHGIGYPIRRHAAHAHHAVTLGITGNRFGFLYRALDGGDVMRFGAETWTTVSTTARASKRTLQARQVSNHQ